MRKDEDARAQVDSGLSESLAEQVESGVVPGGGMSKLAEEEHRRIGVPLLREGSCSTVGSLEEKQGRSSGRAERSQKRQGERQVVGRCERSRGPSRHLGRTEAAFEEARDVSREAERLGPLPQERTCSGPSGLAPRMNGA